MLNFPRETQYNFIASLLLYIRRLIVQERVEDLQLGVESYQNNINLTKPQLIFPGIQELSQYTLMQQTSFGITYLNKKSQLHLMRFDEILKFCDETLRRVREGLAERLVDEKKKLQEGQETRWKANGRRMIRNFVHTIEERLYRREQIRRLESYIGVRPSFPVLTFRRPDPQFTDF
ncbi:hypothetical protein CTI12_AA557910 [Artemisia annua]|uniref:Uncharacterized protein n=1 Tax=Artemisia annua TaxID=35608 RepID=A0A2U1KWG2_ARTAN|nr:hypothetical protein CTI12_AA557910 [Artemisia annua]